MTRTTQLLLPAIRWDPVTRYAREREAIRAALARGVGGFILFGGEAGAVKELTTDLAGRSNTPLLIGSDLERGAGQQFPGATQLPPLAAIGSLDDLSVTRHAGALTAREARALGVNWILAPVADLDIEPRNPIVGTRAFGSDPVRVAAHVTAWIEGCRAEGVLCCAKHFPGHGRTTADSHAVLPVVESTREELEMDLTPFRAAVVAGVDAIMTAHVAFPALDPRGEAATLSGPILETLLRRELGFDGPIVTDAMIMQGVQGEGTESSASVRALKAGCDILLYPSDLETTADAVDRAHGDDLARVRVGRALDRINALVANAPAVEGSWGLLTDQAWALATATRTIRFERGGAEIERAFDLITVDDDLGGPYPPPSRSAFLDGLRDAGFDPRPVDQLDGTRPAVIAVYADIRAWKGTASVRDTARSRVQSAIESRPDGMVILFGHPRLAKLLAGENLAIAWGGEEIMQRAACRWLADESLPPTAA